MAKDTFKWPARIGATGEVRPRTRLIRFGDGYEQRVQDGINNDLRTYSLSFSGQRLLMQEIQAFLLKQGGVTSFYWQAPERTKPGLFVCEEWRDAYHSGQFWEINASFREVVA